MKQMDRLEAERIVAAYADTLLRVSFTYLRSTQDAEDVVQTVFLKLLASGPDFQNAEHEKAWLIRTTINTCKDELRAFRRKAVPLDAAMEREAPEVPSSPVLESVMALPEKYRAAIYLFYYEGYTIQEIASLLGRSESAVAAHLSRGRKKLRNLLDK
ncbi:RNA polymerase sigma factor [Acutalibacter sp. 1XD8-33]|uniref:RNA polymerase sigma factor n=1 Tax=Acutalibacter sp. 1XD8-33 TaxID=2320081 RepID=UPI000EA3924E|nr:RNA polymerase sigma factor [Acutalibacter sp. 1XD8-33]RKJ40759.1 RNA polymerase sigma factor [Acutalibacter sp. 1XD8-33]